MRRLWIVAAILGFSSPLALAATGWGMIVKGGPFEQFRDGDWEMFRQTVVTAADAASDGHVVQWSNAKTDAHGTVKVVEQFESRDYGQCRKLNGQANAKGRTAPFDITLCRNGAESWKIAEAPARR